MTCTATMESIANPGHVHTCNGSHCVNEHMCSAPFCRRWFFTKEV